MHTLSRCSHSLSSASYPAAVLCPPRCCGVQARPQRKERVNRARHVAGRARPAAPWTSHAAPALDEAQRGEASANANGRARVSPCRWGAWASARHSTGARAAPRAARRRAHRGPPRSPSAAGAGGPAPQTPRPRPRPLLAPSPPLPTRSQVTFSFAPLCHF